MEKIRRFIKWWNRPDKSIFMDYLQAFIVIVPIAFVIRTWGYGLYQVPTGSMETTLLVGERFASDKFTYSFLRDPKRGEIIAFNSPLFDYSPRGTFANWWENYVWGPENWTKRVIGLPGEHIQGKINDQGHPEVYINGKLLDEPYLNKFPLVPVNYQWTPRTYDPNYAFEEQPYYKMDGATVRRIQKVFRENGVPTERAPGSTIVGAEGSDIFDVHLKSKEKDGVNEYWVMGDNRLGSGDSRLFGALDGRLIHGRIIFRLFSIDSDDSWAILDLIKHPISFWKKVRWRRWLQFVS